MTKEDLILEELKKINEKLNKLELLEEYINKDNVLLLLKTKK